MSETTLQKYISEVSNSILCPEEEKRLILIFKNKEPDWEEAQEKIIKSNMMFVVKTAFEFSTESQKALELISEGSLSLLESLNKFDPSKGFKFLTYASFDIRGRMLKHILKNNYYSALKISLKNVELAKKAKEYIENFHSENNCSPSSEQVAAFCQIDGSRGLLISELANSQIFSIQSTLDKDFDEKILQIPDDNAPMPYSEVSSKEMSSILNKIISKLSLRQQIIINKRFGLNGEEPTDLATIGEQLSLTKERIRQIEQSVLKLIRKELEESNQA